VLQFLGWYWLGMLVLQALQILHMLSLHWLLEIQACHWQGLECHHQLAQAVDY
jgi:hypothetical protein